MRNLADNANKTETNIIWYVMLGAAVLSVAFAGFSLISFSLAGIIVLAISIFVSVLLTRYTAAIPNTRVILSAKNIFTFWGIIWLGTGGGVLLGASASLTRAFKCRNAGCDRTFPIFADIAATGVAGFFFYVALGYTSALSGKLSIGYLGTPAGVIAAIMLAGLVHFLLSTLLNYIYSRSKNDAPVSRLVADKFVFPAVDEAVSLLATIALYFIFVQFGIEFGLVVVPLAIIGDLAYKIHKNRLAQKTRQITEASRIHLATVEALATAIDARDQVGIGHVRRTQIYAIGIGEMLNLSESEINALRTGALLHDIGKLAVPDHILNKPGRLTRAELEKTKIHASVGASILEKVGFQDPVVPTVKYHHECWDGRGYPEGLKGHNIPLTARILCVADAYDTLRGARPYRPAISRDEACSYLLNGAGSQFDPMIVNVFLNNLKGLEAQIERKGLSYSLDTRGALDITSEPNSASDQSYVEQIKRANHEVFTLYELAREFGSSVNLHETLALFTKKIAEFVPFDTCTVYLLDSARETAAAEHIDGKGGPAFKGRHIHVGEGPTGEALKTGTIVKNVDPAGDFPVSQQDLVDDYVAMVSLPLHADDTLIGAVSLYSREPSGYGEEHLRLLETISRIAADAVAKSLRHLEAETYALTDPMTGLPNARSLHAQFEKEAARAMRGGTSFQLLMLDLDGFKAVNDTFGHKTGDLMLKEIGRIISSQLRDYDFLARYAGDEFVAIVPNAKPEDVTDLCARIESAVNSFALPTSDGVARVGVSLGASGYQKAGDTFDEMIVAADKAMYADKSNRKRLHESSTNLTAELREPVEAGHLPVETEHMEVISLEDVESYIIPAEGCIVELDETHIVSTAVN
ncbi:MAG TPA: diguanylate cyclase [Pyrinomonadaceae bacterium]|nr:diguanylate cyclase [Pyrinomonadaceae bacterium]